MLRQMLTGIAERHPEKTAVVYDQQRISYRSLWSSVQQFTQGLSSLQIKQGDCVALILPNCPEFVVSFYAIASLNAIVLPLNPALKEEELYYYLSDSNASVIITDAKRAEVCDRLISKLTTKPKLILIDGSDANAIPFADLLLSPAAGCAENTSPFDGDVLYQYSSGSTGRPKRVTRTQRHLIHETQNFAETVALTALDTILCVVPLFHAHGLGNCLLAATCHGATLVILEQYLQKGVPVDVPFFFRRPRVLELLQTEQVTIFPSVPYIFSTLAEAPAKLEVNLSNLRLCFSAGNFLPKETFDKFLDRFGVPIRQLYGCTEAGSVCINAEPEPQPFFDSVGAPMKNVEIQIVDELGNELPDGEVGEIIIKSPALTRGYHNLPELNEKAFKDGGFITGDLGKKDAFGHLYITGRKRRLIDTGGHKVDPVEVEDVLTAHHKVKEVVVVGTQSLYGGEVVKAVIVPKEHESCEEKEIFSYCKERLAEFKVPQIIEFREELPRSPLGKILQKDLI